MAAQAVMLALAGTPGIYFHSLFGLRGWPEGADLTGHNRTINRQKSSLADLTALLADPSSRTYQVFARYRELLRARAAQPAFDPYGAMQILPAGEAVLAVLRTPRHGGDAVLCLHNVSGRPQVPDFGRGAAPNRSSARYVDLLDGTRPWEAGRHLAPYQVAWLRAIA